MAPAPVTMGAQPHTDASSVVGDTPVAPRRASRSSGQGSTTEKIKRPPNSFICFRVAMSPCFPKFRAQDVSKICSILWKTVSDEERAFFQAISFEKAMQHKADHPNYKYHPRTKAELEAEKIVKRMEKAAKQVARQANVKACAVDRVKTRRRQQLAGAPAAPVAAGSQGPSLSISSVPTQHFGMPGVETGPMPFGPQALQNVYNPYPHPHANSLPYHGLPHGGRIPHAGVMMRSDISQQQYPYVLQSNILSYHGIPQGVHPSQAALMPSGYVPQQYTQLYPPQVSQIHGPMLSLAQNGYWPQSPMVMNGLPQNPSQNLNVQVPPIAAPVSQAAAGSFALDPVLQPGYAGVESQEYTEQPTGLDTSVNMGNIEQNAELDALVAGWVASFVPADEPRTEGDFVREGAGGIGHQAEGVVFQPAQPAFEPAGNYAPGQNWPTQHQGEIPYFDPSTSGLSQDATVGNPTNVSQDLPVPMWYGP
ncbi:hypothetical protein EVG20_g7986 [Dentipellis fragilis]|uniref:HMG box domain-containing protein n=1 Tax=Dentipellis fragilis TaxID=205917 RepID=A0A4Y9Y8N5_9AGAM|nr:hypothetical protein EVG20_g7986 [Dentipellis fragilis]